MPKETFFNLSEEKREHITNIAIDEFANHNYAEVSISRIVARAGIAKGSFYQYFEDKEDLFSYLLDLAVRRKWELYSLDHPDPQHIGVFRYLVWTAKAGVIYQRTYPALFEMAGRALRQNALPQGFMARMQQEAHKFYTHLVAIGKEQGDIPEEIDSDLAAFVFGSILTNLGTYVTSRVFDPDDPQKATKTVFDMQEVSHIFEQVIRILEVGMGKSSQGQTGIRNDFLVEQEVSR
jgi:AcrR family transcriptional regulator